LTTKVLEAYKQKIESFELVPSSGGCFELKVNDELLYSKLKTGEFPDEGEMVKQVGKRD
jgi:selenoprotein W-related protein